MAGWLTAAIALQRAGFGAVRVVERAPAMGEVGAGITVQTNALLALRAIDPALAEAVASAGQAITRGAIADWRGRELSALSLAEAAAAVGGPPPVALHRATLQRLLLAACRPIEPRLGCACRGYEQAQGRVRARLEGGDAVEADLLIGADGIRSAVRAQLLGEEPPRYAGYTCWRGVTDAPLDGPGDGPLGGPRDRALELWGPGARFGVVPIDGGRTYWFATHDAPPGGQDPEDVQASLLERFAGWAEPVARLIAATPPDRILRNDISDRPPAPRWGEGPVTLLGDAAHPMTPNMGQGACQAIEDAAVLAACLRAEADGPRGLRRYEATRAARAHDFVRRSWRLGRLGQWRHPAARAARDLAVRLTPARTGRALVERAFRFPEAG